MSGRYEAVVLGSGPAGEVAASRLAAHGLRTAICERELLGGECAYWACIPSKTLLRAPEIKAEATRAAGVSDPELDWPAVASYRDFMIRHLDDSKQKVGWERDGVDVFRGEARVTAPGSIEVDGKVLETERLIIATGSDATVPPIDGLSQVGYWTNREATTVEDLPESLMILGGGPVGIELGQFYARFGVAVTIVQSATRLLDREDPAASALVHEALKADGVDIRLSAKAVAARRDGSEKLLILNDGSEVRARELLIATKRSPRVHGLGLENAGIEFGDDGIQVDEQCRAGDGVWAVGDVTGILPFTHVGMYQARIVAAAIAGKDVRADYRAIPRVVFSDPEIAAVGLTETEARDQDFDVKTAEVELADAIARPWTYETEPRGKLGLIADTDTGVLVGAWAVSPLAGEWIHYAALAIKTRTPLAVLADTVAQFPTYSEAYLKGVEKLL